MEIIYGTGNRAKIAYMRRALLGLPIELLDLEQALVQKEGRGQHGQAGSEKTSLGLPEIEETGTSPLENARQKAEEYYRFFRRPVFSCDSGLCLWHHATGKMLPEKEQPGVCVRGRGGRRLSDEELLAHYIDLVRKYGPIRAAYRNAICLVWDERIRAESMDDKLGGESFLLTDIPHARHVEGFPLDSISLDLRTGKYYYDMEEDAQDCLVSAEEQGFRDFFRRFLKERGISG